MRAGTADVLTKSLPKILLNDSVAMPDTLNFEVRHYNPRVLRKALKYLDLKAPESHIKSLYSPSTKVCKHDMLSYAAPCCIYALLVQPYAMLCTYQDTSFYVLRFESTHKRITKALAEKYTCVLKGDEPPPDANEQTGDSLENLKRVMQLCGALHWVCAAPSPGLVFKCDLNPGLLSCTCKSSRATTMCAHIIAVTALYIPSTYSADYLRDLLKKLCKKGKKKAHRPRNALGGQYMQPEGMCLIYVLNLLTYACLCGHTLCYA
jgi:hypothetical protein